VSRYSNIETSLAMSTFATWSHVVQYCDVSPHNFNDLAMSGLAFSVALTHYHSNSIHYQHLSTTPQDSSLLRQHRHRLTVTIRKYDSILCFDISRYKCRLLAHLLTLSITVYTYGVIIITSTSFSCNVD